MAQTDSRRLVHVHINLAAPMGTLLSPHSIAPSPPPERAGLTLDVAGMGLNRGAHGEHKKRFRQGFGAKKKGAGKFPAPMRYDSRDAV